MKSEATAADPQRVAAFAEDVAQELVHGKRYRVAGFGTFSTCQRKAAPGRPACRIAMFRASAELRAYAAGGDPPELGTPHQEAVRSIAVAMLAPDGVHVPGLGRFAVEGQGAKRQKLVFQGAAELNEQL
ncbi:MAG: hypothetical protein AAGE01_07510 [Pseudomonadota bacterium]